MPTPEQQWELDEKRAAQATDMYTLLKDQDALNQERWLRAIVNFRTQVDLQLKKMGKTRGYLAKESGIGDARLSQIFSKSQKKVNITIKTLHRIAVVLDCSVDIRLTTFMGQQSGEPDKPLPGFEEEIMNL